MNIMSDDDIVIFIPNHFSIILFIEWRGVEDMGFQQKQNTLVT